MQQPMTREERLSLARGTDGPYSDIELFVVLRSEGEEFTYEWVAGPWKAEVDFYSANLLLKKATDVEGRWPLTHGSFFHVRRLYDPEGFFDRLREAAASPTDADFRAAIEGTLTGEIYEFAGKWQNARAAGQTGYLPFLAAQTAQYGAFLIGLHHRRTYSTGSKVLEEALALPDRPAGFDALAQLTLSGRLNDPLPALDAFWAGVQEWAATHGYRIRSDQRIPF